MTEDWTGAEIKGLIQTANSYAMDRLFSLNLPEEELKTYPQGLITMADFNRALAEMMLAKLSLDNSS